MDGAIFAQPAKSAGVVDLNSSELLGALRRMAIDVVVFEHPPVFTIEESKALRGKLPGAHVKNLLLRNKKNQLWLVCALEDTHVDMKRLAEQLESGRLSFANPEQMLETLGVRAGAVSPLAVVNDTGKRVRVALEARVLEAGLLNFHPLRNDATAAIRRDDFLRFLEAQDHPPLTVSL